MAVQGNNQEQLKNGRKLYLSELKSYLGEGHGGKVTLKSISADLQRLGYKSHTSSTHLSNIFTAARDASPQLVEGFQELAPDLDPSVLASRKYVFGLSNVVQNMRGQAQRAAQKSRDKFGDEVVALFKQLDQGDVYVLFLVDLVPEELDFTVNIRQEFIEALKRGVTAIYLVPEQSAEWLDRQRVKVVRIEEEANALVNQLSEEVANGRLSEEVANRIHVARVSLRMFMQPGFKFALYCSKSMEAPVATFGAKIGGDTAAFVHLVLDKGHATHMCHCIQSLDIRDWPPAIREALKKHIAEKPGC